jgi:hypothetical protein
LVVVVLVIVWIAVLTPRLVRHFREERPQSSIESFHEQLHLLGRAGPKLVEPAYRLEVPESDRSSLWWAAAGASHATPGLVRGIGQKRSAWERRRSRRRRRDLLLGLAVVAVFTGGLGAERALHLLWAITGVSALAITGYVALVAYAQMLHSDHADREARRPAPPQRFSGVGAQAWAEEPSFASIGTAPVDLLTSRSLHAARAGYPGAWDQEELVSVGVPRHAASGS